MEINYCYRCLEPMDEGRWICPHCGHDNRQRKNDEGLLPEGTVLNGKYLVGRVLGRGGFGVTYLGLELTLKIKVAIKEFFPNGICSRSTHTRTVKISNTPANTEGFARGKEAFQKEAEILAMFSSPSIAHVREYFLENNTAYIVMDYVEGIELGAEIRRCGGRMPWRRVVDLMLPLMQEMDRLHRKKLVHRDIKPANIKIVRDADTGAEHLVLLDFGAARSYTSSNVTETYTQILTPGFAPFEQYKSRTHLGPYTDIYALCATMYAAITGEKPPAAPDRISGDDDPKPFSSYGLDVPDQVEKAIFHGLAVDYHDRPQTMETLWREFQGRPVEPAGAIGHANTSGNDQDLRTADTDPQTKPGKKSKTGLAAALGVLLAAAAFFLFFRSNIIKFPSNILLPTNTDVPTDTLTPFPTDTDVPADTPTLLPTNTDVPTDTPTPVPTNTDIPTDTPAPFPTNTPEPTAVPLDLRAGEIFTFGRYEQDEKAGADPIEWQVLAVENGRALLISRYALEAMKYNEDYGAVTWETCTLRSWLNGAFYGSVFSIEEKSRIAEVTNDNPDNAKYKTDGGISTGDRIFLLSIDEANKYFPNDNARICRATFHAKQNGANTYNGNAWWWLRSPGYGSDVAADVFPDGSVYDSGGYINNSGGSVRPAFWLNL